MLTGLRPFTDYVVGVFAISIYTFTGGRMDFFAIDTLKTAEGGMVGYVLVYGSGG